MTLAEPVEGVKFEAKLTKPRWPPVLGRRSGLDALRQHLRTPLPDALGVQARPHHGGGAAANDFRRVPSPPSLSRPPLNERVLADTLVDAAASVAAASSAANAGGGDDGVTPGGEPSEQEYQAAFAMAQAGPLSTTQDLSGALGTTLILLRSSRLQPRPSHLLDPVHTLIFREDLASQKRRYNRPRAGGRRSPL